MISEAFYLSAFASTRLHLGVCGSIAAYKALDLTRAFSKTGLQVGVTLTAAAREFITPLSFAALGADPVFTDMYAQPDSVYAHLEPGQSARALLIAPASANTLAKLAGGLADTMLSCQALAAPCPVILAPAMNPNLWEAPATQDNVARLQDRDNATIIAPDTGHVACGEHGTGRLAQGYDIYWATLRSLAAHDLQGKRVLITFGPTREFWDPVRFWSNPSSGKMGAAMALTAWLRGADVHCVSGPCAEWLPAAIPCTRVTTAREMYEACLQLWPRTDIGCLTAAVCDYRPASRQKHKFKKAGHTGDLCIDFTPNPDILHTLGGNKQPGQRLIGFAAESESNLKSPAQEKLRAKNLDCIVANRITGPDTGFDTATNAATILLPSGRVQDLPVMSKADIAWKIWDLICTS